MSDCEHCKQLADRLRAQEMQNAAMRKYVDWDAYRARPKALPLPVEPAVKLELR